MAPGLPILVKNNQIGTLDICANMDTQHTALVDDMTDCFVIWLVNFIMSKWFEA